MQATMMGTGELTVPRTNVQTTVRFDPEVYEAALRLAKAAGVSLNTWIAQAVREKVERERGSD